MFEHVIVSTINGHEWTARGLVAANELIDHACPYWAGQLTWERADDNDGRVLLGYERDNDNAVAEIRDVGVTVEYMPEHHRSSHEAAGYDCLADAGRYPGNGAIRVEVERDEADELLEEHGDWARVVE